MSAALKSKEAKANASKATLTLTVGEASAAVKAGAAEMFDLVALDQTAATVGGVAAVPCAVRVVLVAVHVGATRLSPLMTVCPLRGGR